MPRTTSNPKSKPKSEAPARKLKQPEYKSFRLHKRIPHGGKPLPSAWSIMKSSTRHLYEHKKLFLGITTVYLLLSIVLVRGFLVTSDVGIAKEAVQELFTGTTGQFAGALTVFSLLMQSNSATSEAAAVYQSIIVVVISLVTIWALRQTHAGKKVSLREAMYSSSYPLVQFVLVLLVLGLQLLPILIGNFLYSATVSGGVAISALEITLWTLLTFLLVLWSLYMISASAFALYIVTLPDMSPMVALKSAKNLVQLRRWTVLRKVLFLPVFMVILGLGIMLPIIMFATPVAEIIFLLLSSAVIVFSHSYLYSLYRELL
jgi:hypothetical protein